jgi:hypothetical protein
MLRDHARSLLKKDKRPAAPAWLPVLLVRTAFALVFAWAAYAMLAQSGEGALKVEIRDKKTGQITPAMVCITSMEDHLWRTPPDGHVSPRFSNLNDFYTPGGWTAGDIGPVRLMTENAGDDGKGMHLGRSKTYDGLPTYPFWKEPAAYFVSKPFTIQLPAGKWRLAVERGIEYLPVYEDFTVAPGQSLARKIAMARWVDMPRQGWYSGDGHIHYPRTKAEHDQFLLTWAQAEDVHVANILWVGDIKRTYFEQAGYGKEFRRQQGDYVLVSGQEEPRTEIGEQGHTVALNIKATVRDTTRYHLYDLMFDGVHAQGGLAGYAHLAWAGGHYRVLKPDVYLYPTWDPNINAIRGKVDFFEVLQFSHLGLEDYYDFLNLGVKLAACAGSDLPWGGSMGDSRVFAYTGPHFSADAWYAALKQGRTFVTNGPMIALTANNAMPGDELRIARASNVRVKVRAWAPAVIGAPQKLELVSQGHVIRSVESAGEAQEELKLDVSLPASESQWIAARVTSRNGALAHTSPVYILVDGKSFANRAELPQIAGKRLKVLEFIEGKLRDPKFVKEYAPGEVDALSSRIADARARYKALGGL